MIHGFMENFIVEERLKKLEERMKSTLELIKGNENGKIENHGLLDVLRGLRAEYSRISKFHISKYSGNSYTRSLLPGTNKGGKLDIISACGERYNYSECSNYRFIQDVRITRDKNEDVLVPMDYTKNTLNFENNAPVTSFYKIDSSLSQAEHRKEADTIYKNTEESTDNLEYSEILNNLYSEQD